MIADGERSSANGSLVHHVPVLNSPVAENGKNWGWMGIFRWASPISQYPNDEILRGRPRSGSKSQVLLRFLLGSRVRRALPALERRKSGCRVAFRSLVIDRDFPLSSAAVGLLSSKSIDTPRVFARKSSPGWLF
jgi:hypothetical protein